MVARYLALEQAGNNCVTQITAGIDQVNTDHATSLSDLQSAEAAALITYEAAAKKKPLDRDAKDAAKEVLDDASAKLAAEELEMLNEKIEVVSSKIKPLWSGWSDITRVYFPICEFKEAEVPGLLQSIEWIEIRFTKTACDFMMPKTTTNTIALDIKVESAKEAKKKDGKDGKKNEGLFAAQAFDGTTRNVQGRIKAKRKFNGGFAADGLSLTLDDELSIRNREEEDQIVPDVELELARMDDGSNFSVVPSVSTTSIPPAGLQVSAKGQCFSYRVLISKGTLKPPRFNPLSSSKSVFHQAASFSPSKAVLTG